MKEELTCHCKYNSSKWNPATLLVSFEEVVYVVRVESLENAGIMFGNIVNTDEGNANEPRQNAGCERIAHFVSSKSLEGEE